MPGWPAKLPRKWVEREGRAASPGAAGRMARYWTVMSSQSWSTSRPSHTWARWKMGTRYCFWPSIRGFSVVCPAFTWGSVGRGQQVRAARGSLAQTAGEMEAAEAVTATVNTAPANGYPERGPSSPPLKSGGPARSVMDRFSKVDGGHRRWAPPLPPRFRKCVKDPLGVFPDPFTASSRPPPGELPQPLLCIRNELTAGSGERETRLELATSSLEGMCANSSSDWATQRSRARYSRFCGHLECGRGTRRI